MITVRVIYKLMDSVNNQLQNSVPTSTICTGECRTNPSNPAITNCAFTGIDELNDKLLNKISGQKIAIVCGTDFGYGTPVPPAVDALMHHFPDLYIIANSISLTFLLDGGSLRPNLIQCSEITADNTEVDDDIEIQSNKVINKRTQLELPTQPLPHFKPKDHDIDELIDEVEHRFNPIIRFFKRIFGKKSRKM